MEGLVLGVDGTIADYCDILRTHGTEATLAIEVLRYQGGQYLEGQLNGRPLETSFSFESELSEAVGGDPEATGVAYSTYEWVTDDFGSITVEVPSDWVDVDGSPWVDDGEVIGAGISAAASLDDFFSYWDEPGIFFGASDDLAQLGGYVQLLDILRPDFTQVCDLDGRYEYEDILYRGKYDLFTNCGGGAGSLFMVLTAVPIDDPTEFLILLEVQIVNDSDLEAVDRILDSFEVVATLP
jgi:serine protease Do